MMEKITRIVAEFYGIYYKVLFIEGRCNQKQAIAKQMAMLLISEYVPGITTTTIGLYFKRGHSNVIHGRTAMREEIEVNRHRRAEYENFKQQLDKMEFTQEEYPYCRKITYAT